MNKEIKNKKKKRNDKRNHKSNEEKDCYLRGR